MENHDMEDARFANGNYGRILTTPEAIVREHRKHWETNHHVNFKQPERLETGGPLVKAKAYKRSGIELACWILLIACLIYLSIFVFGPFLSQVFAKDKNIDLSIKGVYSIYQDKDLPEDGKGIKGELRYKWIYLWGSWEQTELRLTGQRAGGIRLYGFGPGLKIKLIDGLSLFSEIGYYIPDSDLQKNTMTYSEGIRYKWVRLLNEINLSEFASEFTNYKYEIKPNIGGSIGMDFSQELYKGWHINLFGAYRFLNLKEDWDAYHATIPGSYIQTKEKRSLSGGQFGIGVNYVF